MILKKMAKLRAEKSDAPYSSIVNWLRTQLAFDLVRSNYRCLFGSRRLWVNKKPKAAEEGVYFQALAHIINRIDTF